MSNMQLTVSTFWEDWNNNMSIPLEILFSNMQLTVSTFWEDCLLLYEPSGVDLRGRCDIPTMVQSGRRLEPGTLIYVGAATSRRWFKADDD